MKISSYLIAALGVLAGVCQLAAADRPNILFFFSDDHAEQAISAYGSKVNQTPGIDRLAKEGAIFRNNFCTNSICAPSRAVVITGKFSHLNGVRDNRGSSVFDGSQQTYQKLLGDSGYATAMIGKWHLKSEPTGFDFWQVLPGQGNYYNPDFRTQDGMKRFEGHSTELIASRALEWLDQRDPDKPFLLHCWFKAPHRNWMPAPHLLTLYDDGDLWEPPTLFDDLTGRSSSLKNHAMGIDEHMRMDYDLKVTEPLLGRKARYGFSRMNDEQRKIWDAAYAPKNEALRKANLSGKDLVRWKYQRYVKDYLRCIAGVDEQVARILKYLDDNGLAENTIVVYSSDQGFYLGEHGWFDKRWMYEESLRMPLLVRWPGKIKPGTEITALTQNIDYAPTLLEAAGLKKPADMQGHSLMPFLKGEKPADWRESIYYHYYEYPDSHRVQAHYGVRTDRYKLIYFYPVDEWELIDLKNDPMELRSVYDHPAYASIVKKLTAELKRLRDYYGDDTEAGVTKKVKHSVLKFNSGVRSIMDKDNGWLLDTSNDGAFALQKARKPITGKATFHCKVQTQLNAGVRNGMIAIGTGPDRSQVIRCGIYIGATQYVILGEGNRILAETPARFDQGKIFDVTVEADVPGKTLTLTVDGTTITAPLPASWKAITHYGIAANQTKTAFTEFSVK